MSNDLIIGKKTETIKEPDELPAELPMLLVPLTVERETLRRRGQEPRWLHKIRPRFGYWETP